MAEIDAPTAEPPSRPPESSVARRARLLAWAPWLVLALALVLRVGFAAHKGLVLDELHTYFHATRASLASFFQTLARDNHPPLAFLAVGASARLFGDGELALRMPAIVFGLVEIVLVARLARRLPEPHPAWVAAGLLAVSSLHLDFSTQARMYALLALCVTGFVSALLELLERPAGESAAGPAFLTCLWCVAGLHAHYFFLQYLGLIGLGTLLVVATHAELRPRARRLVLPALAALALSAPWYLWGFRAQLAHALPPGGDSFGVRALAEAFVHLFFLNVRLGGPVLRLVFIGCGGLSVALGVLGALRLATRARGAEARLLVVVLATVAFGVPLVASVVATLVPRAGFTWHYVLPSAAALALLVAAAAGGGGALAGARRGAVALVGGAALLLSVLNAVSRGTEDYPGAVHHILAEHRAGDAVVSVEWQPPLFPQGQPWDYYAPRLADGAPPARLAMNDQFGLADPRELAAYRRVLMLKTSLPDDQHLMRRLAENGFAERSRENHGFGVDVLVFERR